MQPLRPEKTVTAGHDGSISLLAWTPGRSRAQRHDGFGLDRDLVVEGRSADREREAGVRGVPGLSANSNRAPATNPTGRATRSSRACPSSRACLQPLRPAWRRSPAGARASS